MKLSDPLSTPAPRSAADKCLSAKRRLQSQAELGFRVPSRQALLANGKLERNPAPGVAALQSRDLRTERGSGVSFGGRILLPKYLTEPRWPFPQTPESSSQGPARSSEVCSRAAFPRRPGGAIPRPTRKRTPSTRLDCLGSLRVTFLWGTLSSSRGLWGEGDARTSERCSCAAVSLHWHASGLEWKTRSYIEGQSPPEEESPALWPLGWKNAVFCLIKPSKKLASVVSKPAYFHVTQFKLRVNVCQGIVRVESLPSPLTPGAPPGGKGSGVGANLGTGLKSREKMELSAYNSL